MRNFITSSLALLLVAGAGCTSGDAVSDEACTPGQQVACACDNGDQGVQACSEDGSAFGTCTGCDNSSGLPTSSNGAGGSLSGSGGSDGSPSASGSGAAPSGSGGSGGAPSGSGGAPFFWEWLDYGGPAFLPHACAWDAGVVDGMLVDPHAFFESLIANKDPNDWALALNEIEPQLWACGLGQQRDSGGAVRGRLYLPTDACPDAAPPPDDAQAIFLGVRQEPACWDHKVDVVGQ